MIRAVLTRARNRLRPELKPDAAAGANALSELLRVGAAHDLSGEMLLTIL